MKMIVQGGNSPPVLKEILQATTTDFKQVRSLLNLLEKEGEVVRVQEDLYFPQPLSTESSERLLSSLRGKEA